MEQYQLGLENKYDDQTAVKWFRRSAQQGYAPAQIKLGEAYALGKGAPEDDVEAVYWYKKAASQNNLRAQILLGSMYEKGAGVDRDEAKAIELYTRAASQQYPPAMFNLGVLYARRLGDAQNFVRAHKWFNLANRGTDYPSSMLRTMERLMTTPQILEAQAMATEWEKEFITSLPEDPEPDDFLRTPGDFAWPGDELGWINLREVEKGNGNAEMFEQLGNAYWAPTYNQGRGFATNSAEAERWYELAAQGGNAGSMIQLARMYFDLDTHEAGAVGIEKDRIKAYMWAHLSRRYGGQSYTGWNQALTAGMTDEDIALAKEMADDWIKEYPPPREEP